MGRKKKNVINPEVQEVLPQINNLQTQYLNKLESDSQYSLEVDPENKYNMPLEQKEFIKQYVEFKSIAMAAQLAKIDSDRATQYFIAYSTQQEIRRINKALYNRQFASKLLSLDEIGGYLSSLLTGENVPLGEQPHKVSEKIEIAKLIIQLNQLKAEGMLNPQILMSNNIEVQIKELSLSTIKHLLAEDNLQSKGVLNQQAQLTNQHPQLTPEETAYLSTLPVGELLKIIDETEGGK